jgi:hypothetical protein
VFGHVPHDTVCFLVVRVRLEIPEDYRTIVAAQIQRQDKKTLGVRRTHEDLAIVTQGSYEGVGVFNLTAYVARAFQDELGMAEGVIPDFVALLQHSGRDVGLLRIALPTMKNVACASNSARTAKTESV